MAKRSSVTVLSVLLSMFLSTALRASAKAQLTLTYDHFNGTLTPSAGPLSVSHGGLIVFKVTNVNKFIYTVTVNSGVVSRFADIPAAFAKQGPVSPEVPQGVVQRAPAPPRAVPVPPRLAATQEQIEDEAFAEQAAVVDQLLSAAHHLSDLPQSLKAIVYSDSIAPVTFDSLIRSLVDGVPPFEDAWRRLVPRLQESLQGLARVTKARHKPRYDSLKTEVDGVSAQNASMIASLKEANELWLSVDRDTFEGPTVTFQATGDSATIGLKSDLREGQHGTRVYDLKPFLVIESPGGLKIDFSSGLMVSSLRDPSYVVNSDGKIERSGYENAATFAAAALVHAYTRGNGIRFPGVSFGIGVSTDRLSYFLGASVLGVAESRLVITAGVTAGQVKLLGGGHRLGDAFDPKNGNIPTDPKIRFGGFIGVSYNFTSSSGQGQSQ